MVGAENPGPIRVFEVYVSVRREVLLFRHCDSFQQLQRYRFYTFRHFPFSMTGFDTRHGSGLRGRSAMSAPVCRARSGAAQ